MAAKFSCKGGALTLLLVGKTGNGKSSTGNTILEGGSKGTGQRRKFSTAVGFSSNTLQMEVEECQTDRGSIKVINTPDFKQFHQEESSKKADKKQEKKKKLASRGQEDEDDYQKVAEWIASGPIDAVVLVIRADCRYTAEESKVYQRLKKALERKLRERKPGYSIRENLIVAFTMGDCLNGRDLRKDLQDASPELNEVLKDAGQRYVVFDNKAGQLEKEAVVDTLLHVVGTMKPHPFPQQVCRLLLSGEEGLQQAVAAMLCRQYGGRGLLRNMYFYSYGPSEGSSAKQDFGSLKLEVVLTPEGREDAKTQESVWQSVSPGPHAVLYVTTRDVTNSRLASSSFLDRLAREHRLTVVVGGQSFVPEADLKNKVGRVLDSKRVVVLPDLSETSRLRLLSEVNELVTSNEGRHFRNDEMDELADKLQDKLSANLRVTYQDYLKLKRDESQRHFDSKRK